MTLWLVASLLNLVALTKLFLRLKRERGYIKTSGVIHLSLYAILLGPAFTLLILLYLYAERTNDYSR